MGHTITVYASQNNVTKAPATDSLGSILWFMRVQWWRRSRCFDGAESTASCACISHKLATRHSVQMFGQQSQGTYHNCCCCSTAVFYFR